MDVILTLAGKPDTTLTIAQEDGLVELQAAVAEVFSLVEGSFALRAGGEELEGVEGLTQGVLIEVIPTVRQQARAELAEKGFPLSCSGFARRALLGDVEGCRLFVAAGFHPNGDEANRPLVEAASVNNVAVVRLLLENGAAVGLPSHNGSTALQSAGNAGHADTLEALLAHEVAEEGRLAPLLETCVAHNHVEAVAVLIAHGADVHKRDHHGRPLLHVAARRGHVETVTLLLSKGVDPHAKTKQGGNALDQAKAFSGDARKRNGTISVLEKRGVVPAIKPPTDVCHASGYFFLCFHLGKVEVPTSITSIYFCRP